MGNANLMVLEIESSRKGVMNMAVFLLRIHEGLVRSDA